MATYKYLVKDFVAIDYGMEVQGYEGTVLPLSNMELGLLDTELAAGKAVLLSEGRIESLIDNKITSVGQIAGTVHVCSKAGVQSAVDDFNQGLNLTFTNGDTYNQTVSNPGDSIIISECDNPSQIVLTEQALVDATNTMTLITSENAQDVRVSEIETENTKQDAEIANLKTELDKKVGGVFGRMELGYAPQTNLDVVTKSDTDNLYFLLNGLIGNSGDGSFNTLTNTKTIDAAQDARLAQIESDITNGAGVNVVDAHLSWEGLEDAISATNDEAIFDLPLIANKLSENSAFDYSNNQVLDVGVTDGVATSTVSMTIGQPSEENFYFKDSEIAVIGRISSVNPGQLILSRVNGNKDISDTLKLSKINQHRVKPALEFATNDDLVQLESDIQNDLNLKQNLQDQSLNTNSKFVVGAINNNKEAIDSTNIRTAGVTVNNGTTEIDDKVPLYTDDGKLIIDITDLKTYKAIYDGYGVRYNAGDTIRVVTGKTGTYDTGSFLCNVGVKTAVDDVVLTGTLFANSGTSKQDLYLSFPSNSSDSTLTFDAWDEIMVVANKKFANIGFIQGVGDKMPADTTKQYIIVPSGGSLSSIYQFIEGSSLSAIGIPVIFDGLNKSINSQSNIPIVIWEEV